MAEANNRTSRHNCNNRLEKQFKAWSAKKLKAADRGFLVCVSQRVFFDFDANQSRPVLYQPSLTALKKCARVRYADLKSVRRLERAKVFKRRAGHANLFEVDRSFLINQARLFGARK
jgi:hypothetical protein